MIIEYLLNKRTFFLSNNIIYFQTKRTKLSNNFEDNKLQTTTTYRPEKKKKNERFRKEKEEVPSKSETLVFVVTRILLEISLLSSKQVLYRKFKWLTVLKYISFANFVLLILCI
jgi:hypothetical protein